MKTASFVSLLIPFLSLASCGMAGAPPVGELRRAVSDSVDNLYYAYTSSDVVSAGSGSGRLRREGRCLVFETGGERYSPVFLLREGASLDSLRVVGKDFRLGDDTYRFDTLYRFNGLTIHDDVSLPVKSCPTRAADVLQIEPL